MITLLALLCLVAHAVFSPCRPSSTYRQSSSSNILLHAALVDVRALAALAQTCKQLGATIYDEDQHVWKTVCLALYDDPRRARAFPAPRSSVDWRMRVTERDNAVRAVEREERSTEGIYRRVFTALRLWDDMSDDPSACVDKADSTDSIVSAEPSLLDTSRNAELFVIVGASCLNFYHIGTNTFNKSATMSATCRLHSLLVDWSGNFDHLHKHLLFTYYEALQDPAGQRVIARENEWAPLSRDGTVWWNAVDVAVSTMLINTRYGQTHEDLGTLALDMEMDIDTVCGTGLFPSADGGGANEGDFSFDWAGVHAQWYGACGEGLGLDQGTGPVGPFDLYPVQTWGEVEVAYADAPQEYATASTTGLQNKLCAADLKALLDTELPTCPARAPVWFYGHTTPGHQQHFINPYPQAFVAGVVRLTPETDDEPPHARWTMVVLPAASDPAGSDRSMGFQGIQVGGARAKRGVFGFWRDLDEDKADKGEKGPAWWWTIGKL